MKMVKVVVSHDKYIKTNLGMKQLLSLAVLAKEIPDGSTTFHTIHGVPKYINNISYWCPDEEKTDKLLKQLFQ